MADPITIGLVAMQVAGPIIEGIGGNKAARSQASALEQDAIAAGTQGSEDALYGLRQGRLQAGADLAGSAAGGVGAGNGTLSDMMRANAEARWQQAFNTQGAASKEADNLRTQAKSARSKGRSALFGGFMRAGAAALGGVGNLQNQQSLTAANGRRREFEARTPASSGTLPMPWRGG